MNEILNRTYIKQVMKQGVPHSTAEEIVATAMEASKGKDVQLYIHYALRLVYGMDFQPIRQSG